MSQFGENSGDLAARLAALRAEIDAVDEALHDLVMRRAVLSLDMGALKAADSASGVAPGNPIRPAREAAILRKLAARHSGAPPFPVVVQIWRELIAANLRSQCPFELAILETQDGGLWDMAHAAYGALTPAVAYFRPREVIRAVSAAPEMLGILPSPAFAPPDLRMWPELLAADGAPRIVCALPHVARDSWPVAFAVGHAPNEPSGDDVSLLLLTGQEPVLTETDELAGAGLDGNIDAAWPAMSPPGLHCAFARVRGFLMADDSAFAALRDMRRQAGGTAALIGTAPSPITPTDD